MDTPELQKLGMRMELDKQTGQMKLVRTDPNAAGNTTAAMP